MSVILIAENLLAEDDFSAATEQAGPHIGQPEPDNGNTGSLRLLALDNADNEIADFSYNATATSDGAVDGTTVICSNLSMFGNDFFIGATIEITSGAYSGQTRTVSDFTQSTGTPTVSSAFGGQITSGTTFTLSISCATREFKAELTVTGDTGAATFKWSHDGGTTYFGRNNPNQADWLGANEIYGSVDSGTRIPTVQAKDYALLAFYAEGGSTKQRRSTNGGLTYGSASTIASGSPASVIKLSSGRLLLLILLSGDPNIYYSDDNGSTWALRATFGVSYVQNWPSLVEMANGNVLMAYSRDSFTNVYGVISDDDFSSWGSVITIASEANYQDQPALGLAANGRVICFYRDDSDVLNDKEIKLAYSDDNGPTWTADVAVADYGGSYDLNNPAIIRDINGDLYCVFQVDTADQKVAFVRSTNNGGAWGSQTDLKSVSAVDLAWPCLCLFDGHEILCSYLDATNSDADITRRGIWEAFSANGCLCPEEALKQRLVCDVGVVWLGYGGITGDKWSFSPEHDFGMSNMIEDSPLKCFRSTQDNIACAIVIDMGANERFFADGAAFFGCNVRTLSFQMNASDSWGSPSVDESVSFDLITGAVDSVDGNLIEDSSLLAGYADHYFKANKHFLRMISGTASGTTWEIRDNAGNYLMMDTTAALTGVSASDTFAIFQAHVSKTFTGGKYRFMRINIAAQHTADDYYQIGVVIAGKGVALTHGFARGYQRDHDYDIEMLRTPHGGTIPIKGADRKRIFQLTWRRSNAGQKELASLLDYVEGKNICLIPDNTDMTNCYLVKLIGGVRQRHVILDRFDVSILLEEVL